eukprot:2110664-Pleurochrysis_carterae.AAC.1
MEEGQERNTVRGQIVQVIYDRYGTHVRIREGLRARARAGNTCLQLRLCVSNEEANERWGKAVVRPDARVGALRDHPTVRYPPCHGAIYMRSELARVANEGFRISSSACKNPNAFCC